jgi:hypothetical protein
MTYNERNFVAADILRVFVHKVFKVLDSKSGNLSRILVNSLNNSNLKVHYFC